MLVLVYFLHFVQQGIKNKINIFSVVFIFIFVKETKDKTP